MRVAIIGRTEILFETAEILRRLGHDVSLFITSKEAPEYTKTSEDFKRLAASWGVPFIHTPQILDTIEVIKTLPEIDIGVSLNYSGVIPQSIIDMFPLGILNAHGGDLPKYRGNACQAWAILNGESRVGLCIHRMIGGELDSGDIVAKDYFPISQDTKVTAVYKWMSRRIPHLFVEALQSLTSNPLFFIEKQSKNPADSLRCYPRRPSDGRIDWSLTAEAILRLINACNKPYAGAFCDFEGKPLIIWDAEIAPSENFLAIPGQVTETTEAFVEVACGSGKLRLKQVEHLGHIASPFLFIRSIRLRLN
jgi:methionyl-tRNA formyltransferase